MIKQLAVAALGALLLTAPAHAGRWFVGLGYSYAEAGTGQVGETLLPAIYPKGGEIRGGWEYDWYLAIEGRLQKSFGESGSTHSNFTSPSIGIRLQGPKELSQRLFITAGLTYIYAKSNNQVITTTTPDLAKPLETITVTTYEPYPSLKRSTWYAGAGYRFCDEKESICPRVEMGWRGSDTGGPYAGIGIDFRFP